MIIRYSTDAILTDFYIDIEGLSPSRLLSQQCLMFLYVLSDNNNQDNYGK